jgi:acyl-CoA thioesterase II
MSDATKLLELTAVGEGRYRVPQGTAPEGRDVVYGGETLAQQIVASAQSHEGLYVKSISTIFSRAGSYSSPLELIVEPIQAGRTWASDVVTAVQNDKVLAKGLVLLTAENDDLVRHAPAMPSVPGPDDVKPASQGLVFPGAEVRVVEEAGTSADGLPVSHLWTRMPEKIGSVAASQGILAYNSNGWIIGLAISGHPGEVRVEDTHHTIRSGVIGHTINFHDEFDAGDWILISQESTWAGRGRTHGRGLAFTQDGRLVATFSQDSMLAGANAPMGSSSM